MSQTTKLTGLSEITTLMNSRRRSILINTYEEERLQEDLKTIAETKGYHIFAWSITSGVVDCMTGEIVHKIFDPLKIMEHINSYGSQAMFIIKDFHDIWTNYQAKRKLRDTLERPDKVYKPILLVSPTTQIPMELEKLITVVSYELPDRERVIQLLESIEAMLISKELPIPTGRQRDAIIHALVGMTESEIINVLKKSAAKNKEIVLSEITAEKEQVIRKTGLLEYITKLGDMKNVGGIDNLRNWFDDAYYAFEPEAAAKFNIDPVRGVVLAGFPGTGKSLSAKSVAAEWNLPLLKMNMGDIMDSRVGQSEKNIDRALKLAEAVSPCVLWIDEFEKGLAGMSSSDRSDAGTMSRVVQTMLTWLSEKEKPVFVVATANDITRLPAELTRAGRFDEIFFVGLPHELERRDIFKIHLRKRGYTISEDPNEVLLEGGNTIGLGLIDKLAEATPDFSGAEIEQVVAEAGRRAFAGYRKGERDSHFVRTEDLLTQAERLVPLSKRDPILLQDLRKWAKQSAKCASSKEHDFIHSNGYREETNNRLRVINDIEV